MDRTGSNEGVDTTGIGIGQRLGGTVDIRVHRPGQTADPAVLDGVGNAFHRLEITRTGNRKTGFDHIHPQFFQGTGNAQLLFPGHGRTGALLAITQGGIENDDAILTHLPVSSVVLR